MQRASQYLRKENEYQEMKRELETKDERINQQDQLIRILQSRLGEKRVVPISNREPSQNSAKNENEVMSADSQKENVVGNVKTIIN